MDILKDNTSIREFSTFKFSIPLDFIKKDRLTKMAIFFAFLIDEGNIEDKIEIRIANKKALESLRGIMISLGYKIYPIRKSSYNGVPIYILAVANKEVKKLLKDYTKLIKRYPSCRLGDQEESLKFIVKRNQFNWTHRFSPQVDKIILNSLINNPKTVKDLSRILLLSHNNPRRHLKRLYKKRIVKIIGKKNLSNLWGISNEDNYKNKVAFL